MDASDACVAFMKAMPDETHPRDLAAALATILQIYADANGWCEAEVALFLVAVANSVTRVRAEEAHRRGMH